MSTFANSNAAFLLGLQCKGKKDLQTKEYNIFFFFFFFFYYL